jgi:hypothetical protein
VSVLARPLVIDTVHGMREAIAAERASGHSIALTPTLGALHDGHLAHVERAAELADIRVRRSSARAKTSTSTHARSMQTSTSSRA